MAVITIDGFDSNVNVESHIDTRLYTHPALNGFDFKCTIEIQRKEFFSFLNQLRPRTKYWARRVAWTMARERRRKCRATTERPISIIPVK